jgi:hypothetical protein
MLSPKFAIPTSVPAPLAGTTNILFSYAVDDVLDLFHVVDNARSRPRDRGIVRA